MVVDGHVTIDLEEHTGRLYIPPKEKGGEEEEGREGGGERGMFVCV